MPELPEVETIARMLREGKADSPAILGRQIISAELFWPRTLATPGFEEFQKRIAGQTIQGVGRRGKFLRFSLTPDTLLIHLRMSGDIFIRPQDAPPAPHDRLILALDGNLQLAFNDARKFGRVWLAADPQEVLGKLGPEPFDPDFTPQELFERLHGRRRLLKPLLLDQTFIAGLGNIYADEALHRAGLHPLSLSDSLGFPQVERLHAGIRRVLEEGIRGNGASIDWAYRGGDFQNHFRVYRRTGKPCPVCGTPIVRLVVGQRSTHYCPVCQAVGQRSTEY